MPIYEFYCKNCHMIFNFFSRSVDTEKRPDCPKCEKKGLKRQVSIFSTIRNRQEDGDDTQMPDIDETKMEQAFNMLAKEAGNINEDDPKQAANLMRKLTDMTGLDLGDGMKEALSRMEAGEDPEKIEAEMGDLLEGEDPFNIKERLSGIRKNRPPQKDEKMYYL